MEFIVQCIVRLKYLIMIKKPAEKYADGSKNRVATAQGKQGKQGIWFLLFPDRENTGNFVLTQGKIC